MPPTVPPAMAPTGLDEEPESSLAADVAAGAALELAWELPAAGAPEEEEPAAEGEAAADEEGTVLLDESVPV